MLQHRSRHWKLEGGTWNFAGVSLKLKEQRKTKDCRNRRRRVHRLLLPASL